MNGEIKKFDLSNRLFIAFVVLLVGILSFWAFQAFLSFKSLPANYPREITVSGQGKTFVTPDIALLKLGVETEGMKIADIFKENSEKMNLILKEIKDSGIEEKDIQTTNYNLSPRYEWTKNGQRIFKGYTLTQEIRVKIRNFEKIGDVLEKSTQKGANLVGDLEFTIDEPEKIKEIARKEAIENAKAKAIQVANETGLKLVKVINVYEEYYYPTTVETLKEGGLGGGTLPETPEILPGQQEVSLTIHLVYRVR